MNTNDLVSVVIPAYNHERYIQETIKAIINQTYENIELIIINDGSTDSTYEKIEEMQDICQKRFSRFLVKNQKNQGLCKIMNTTITLSNGGYIYFIASDDIPAPIAIEKLHEFLSQHEDFALAVGENKLIDSESKQCYWDINKNIVYNIDEAFYYSYSDFLMKWATNINFFSEEFGSYPLLLKGNHVPNGSLIRKSIFEKTGPYREEIPLEDYYMMLQIAKYSKMKYIPKTLFYYRWHSNNSIKQAEKMSKYNKQTRRYEIKLVKESNNTQIQKYMNDYLNSFNKEYYIKIPFILEIFKVKTSCFQKIALILFGIQIELSNKPL